MKNIFSRLITKLVYPDGLCCVLCEKELPDGSDLCENCRPIKNSHYCTRCGRTLSVMTQEYCDHCVSGDPVIFDRARAPHAYSDEHARHIVWKLKYDGARYMAKIMAKSMLEVLALQPWQIDLITFVPIHPKKKREREYNQTQLLANEISDATGIPVVNALTKLTYSKISATKLGREDRARLLAGSFALNGENLKNKSVLLVDDVMTTGATAEECAKMLRFGKAKRVYILTYATSAGDSPLLYDPNIVQKIR